MQMTSHASLRTVFSAVFPFHASPEVVASMVPANVDRRRERVSREEMLNLFGSELRGDAN